MKKMIKLLIIKQLAVSPEQVLPLLKKTDCKMVSFDIFDTLLKRNVTAPQDVFHLLEKQYQQHFGRDLPVYELRSQAEERAVQRTGRKEVSLSEIYQAIDQLDEGEREWLMAEEIRIEQAVCQRCQPMWQVYERCMSMGLPVILVSDMYLSRDTITELLRAAGYSGWKRLYISVEDRSNKADGTLFDTVLREEQLSPGELLHIGDSPRSDYLMPRRKGIQAILINE